MASPGDRSCIVPPSSMTSTAGSLKTRMMEFIDENRYEGSGVKELASEWSELLQNLDIYEKARMDLDPWYKKCFEFSGTKEKLEANQLTNKLDADQLVLFNEYSEMMHRKATSSHDLFIRCNYDKHLEKLETTRPEDWITKVILCVKKENQLIASFYQRQRQEKAVQMMTVDEDTKPHDILCGLEAKINVIKKSMSQLKAKIEEYRVCEEKLSTENDKCERMHALLLQASNGKSKNEKILQSCKKNHETYYHRRQEKKRSIEADKKKLEGQFEELKRGLSDICEALKQKVKIWRKDFTLQCVELKSNVTLDGIASWCSKTGYLLSLAVEEVKNWREIIDSMGDGMDDKETDRVAEMEFSFHTMFQTFTQATFVISEQTENIVKTDKKSFPTISVRILSLEGIKLQPPTVKAYFLNEETLNKCWREEEGKLDFNEVSKQSCKFQCGSEVRLKCDSPSKPPQGHFPNLKLKLNGSKFERQKSKLGLAVHEDKYRLIFFSSDHGFSVWTLSLPIVVITGAVQGCHAQASVMWQCYSTDVFELPIDINKDHLPWDRVADMLNDKMKNLCAGRPLTPDHTKHLKRRLLGKQWKGKPDSVEITLKQFCIDKMDKVSPSSDDKCTFSFWKWFLGIFNLLEKYLLNYWRDDLIEGFISKDDAEKKLLDCRHPKNGLFMLRFSDSNITDSQGIKSVFGVITAAHLKIDTNPHTGMRDRQVNHIDMYGNHKKLKDKNLATLLNETMDMNQKMYVYQYPYPGRQTRDEAFSKYYSKGTVVEGYTVVQDALLVDLEQRLQKIEIKGKHKIMDIPVDQSSMGDPLSPPMSEGKRAMKKARRTLSSNTANSPMVMSPGASSVSSSFCNPPTTEDRRMKPTERCPVLSGMLKTSLIDSVNTIPTTVHEQGADTFSDTCSLATEADSIGSTSAQCGSSLSGFNGMSAPNVWPQQQVTTSQMPGNQMASNNASGFPMTTAASMVQNPQYNMASTESTLVNTTSPFMQFTDQGGPASDFRLHDTVGSQNFGQTVNNHMPQFVENINYAPPSNNEQRLGLDPGATPNPFFQGDMSYHQQQDYHPVDIAEPPLPFTQHSQPCTVASTVIPTFGVDTGLQNVILPQEFLNYAPRDAPYSNSSMNAPAEDQHPTSRRNSLNIGEDEVNDNIDSGTIMRGMSAFDNLDSGGQIP